MTGLRVINASQNVCLGRNLNYQAQVRFGHVQDEDQPLKMPPEALPGDEAVPRENNYQRSRPRWVRKAIFLGALLFPPSALILAQGIMLYRAEQKLHRMEVALAEKTKTDGIEPHALDPKRLREVDEAFQAQVTRSPNVLNAMSRELKTLAKKVKPAVVGIDYPLPSEEVYGRRSSFRGSGFVIRRDGLILTNAHVVQDRPRVTVKLLDGRQYDAVVVKRDKDQDIALVKVAAPVDLPTLSLAESEEDIVGEIVLAVGHPHSHGWTVTMGLVSATGRTIPLQGLDGPANPNMIQTDAAINPGNSGGPLVTTDGKVLGMNTALLSPGSSIGYCVTASKLRQFVDDALRE
jgi:S1-C subfamily serine protease